MDYEQMTDEELLRYTDYILDKDKDRKADIQLSLDYYQGKQDILNKTRKAIGPEGKLIEISNLPNSQIVDNQFAKAVDQKVNYLYSQIPTVECEDDESYQKDLQKKLYTRKFMRTLNKVELEAIIAGIGWMYVYPSEDGKELKYKKENTLNITPIWEDAEHEKLNALIREYSANIFIDGKSETIEYRTFYTNTEIRTYERKKGGKFTLVERTTYIKRTAGKTEEHLNMGKIPFIYFKGNSKEIPLLNKCKSLQDGINQIMSMFQDNMLEDSRSSIFVVTNYEGQSQEEFRYNLSQLSTIFVESYGDAPGSVDTIQVEVNADNYKTLLELLKDKLIENTRSLDTRNNRYTQAQNQLDIKNMYADIELDANAMEVETQASLEHLEWFYRKIKGLDPEGEKANVKFKRNITVNDESVIRQLRDSIGIISKETLVANHPMIENVTEELERIKKEKEEQADSLYNPFLEAYNERQ